MKSMMCCRVSVGESLMSTKHHGKVAVRWHTNCTSWHVASWHVVSWHAAWHAASWHVASWHVASWHVASWHAASWHVVSWHAASWHVASWHAASWYAASWHVASWHAASWHAACKCSPKPSLWVDYGNASPDTSPCSILHVLTTLEVARLPWYSASEWCSPDHCQSVLAQIVLHLGV